MKKFIFALAIVTLFATGAGFAKAATMTMTPSQHPVYGPADANGKQPVIGYYSNIDWDATQAEAQARNGQHLPIVNKGNTTTDEAGVVYTCPAWFSMNCVSLVKTPAYRANMINIARTLLPYAQFYPRFAGWFKIVK